MLHPFKKFQFVIYENIDRLEHLFGKKPYTYTYHDTKIATWQRIFASNKNVVNNTSRNKYLSLFTIYIKDFHGKLFGTDEERCIIYMNVKNTMRKTFI